MKSEDVSLKLPKAVMAQTAAEGEELPRRIFRTGREDGRFQSTAGFVHAYMRNLRPKLAFDPKMKPEDFPAWREAVRAKLRELMCFPEGLQPQSQPQRLWSKQRDGYRLEKWEAYPEPYSVVPYLMLIPDGISAQSAGPAVMCFPGSASSKELLAGEPELDGQPSTNRHESRNHMALEYTRKGIVTVAMENPATNELDDSVRPNRSGDLIMNALWVGRPYEAVSVFQKLYVLQWLQQQPFVDANRIAISGHSLGAKPALILGVLDRTVKAVVWNDGICSWRQRAVATNLCQVPLWHYVPGMLSWFDYHPDLTAALAPRPLLATEGGRQSIIDRIYQAYRLIGAADQVKIVHLPQFDTPQKRPFDSEDEPEDRMTLIEYHPYMNTDASQHYFKGSIAVPWLSKIL